MIPLIPIIIIGGVIWAAVGKPTFPQLVKKIPPLSLPPPPAKMQESSAKMEENSETSSINLFNLIQNYFFYWDQKYQNWMQSHFDPKIIGETRHQQMLELTGETQRPLSASEKQINRRLLLGSGALGLLTLGYLTSISFTPIILAIALFNFIPLIKESWRIAVEERRLSLLHLLSFYFAYMWLSGYYLIGTLGAILFNRPLAKVKVGAEYGDYRWQRVN